MEKIVKLEEFNWVSGRDAVTIALCNTIIRKQNEIIDHLNSQDQEEDILKDTKLFSSWVHNGREWKEYIPEEWREDWEVDTRIIPPSFYKELKKHKYNMKKYIKSKLVKLTTK